jgi:Ribosomal protein L9, N-terminal domain
MHLPAIAVAASSPGLAACDSATDTGSCLPGTNDQLHSQSKFPYHKVHQRLQPGRLPNCCAQARFRLCSSLRVWHPPSLSLQVVLLQSVPRLGSPGELVSVANGMMTNYLIPQKLAKPATDAILKYASNFWQLLQRWGEAVGTT